MTIVAFIVFAGALAASMAVFAATLVPALPRIAALLSGREDLAAIPQLVLRDRHPQSRVRSVRIQPARRAAA